LVRDKLLVPRIRTRDGAPVTVPGRTSTPAAFAIKRSVTFAIGAVSTNLAASIRAIEVPTCFLASSPVEVTTTSSSEYGARPNAKSTTAVSPGATAATRDAAP